MNKHLEFYFDFVSPYSYIAHKEILKLVKNNSLKVDYKPILLGGLHNMHGIKAPAFIPSKARFMIRDCKMISEKYNQTFKFNSYFPIQTVNLMRGVFVAEEDGFNMNDQNIIDKILKNIGVNPKTFYLRSTTTVIKDKLKDKTTLAFERGVFGAPTFLVNNKIFWGQDRLEFALKELLK